jgi:hypothetical protein
MWKVYEELIDFECERGNLLEIAGFLDEDERKLVSGYNGLSVIDKVQ